MIRGRAASAYAFHAARRAAAAQLEGDLSEWLDDFERERVAIMEIDGGLPRAAAEVLARARRAELRLRVLALRGSGP